MSGSKYMSGGCLKRIKFFSQQGRFLYLPPQVAAKIAALHFNSKEHWEVKSTA